MDNSEARSVVTWHVAACQRAAAHDDVREAVTHLKSADRALHRVLGGDPAPWMSHALVQIEELRHALEVPAREWDEQLRKRIAHYRERERNAARSRGVNDHGPFSPDPDDD